jgi:hypothetical protein
LASPEISCRQRVPALPKGSAALICNWTSWHESGPFWAPSVIGNCGVSRRSRSERAGLGAEDGDQYRPAKAGAGQTEKGRELLQAAYARFTEGLDADDLLRASRLLEELGRPRLLDAGSA